MIYYAQGFISTGLAGVARLMRPTLRRKTRARKAALGGAPAAEGQLCGSRATRAGMPYDLV